MRKHYRRIFQTNPEKLQEMLTLADKGCSCSYLARKYAVDHTTILYWCKKHKLKLVILSQKGIPHNFSRKSRKLLRKPKFKKAKCYRDYLENSEGKIYKWALKNLKKEYVKKGFS